MVMDRNGGAGRMVAIGSVVTATLALVGGIYSVGQNAAGISSKVDSLEDQIHIALRSGEERLARTEAREQATLDRNCRLIVGLTSDVRLALAQIDPQLAAEFRPLANLSC